MLASASFSQAFCKQFSEFGHYTTISIPHNCDNLSSMLSTLPKVQRPHPELCRGFFQGCLESHVWKSSAHTSRSSSWTSFYGRSTNSSHTELKSLKVGCRRSQTPGWTPTAHATNSGTEETFALETYFRQLGLQ